jgi:hypothetical protein
MVDGSMVRHRPIQRIVSIEQKKSSMVDEGKRVMMCHATSTSMCHAMSSSTCHATLSKLTPWDDVSCHISIHVSFHVNICHVSREVVDGRWSGRLNWGSGLVSQWLSSISMGQWSGIG